MALRKIVLQGEPCLTKVALGWLLPRWECCAGCAW